MTQYGYLANNGNNGGYIMKSHDGMRWEVIGQTFDVEMAKYIVLALKSQEEVFALREELH